MVIHPFHIIAVATALCAPLAQTLSRVCALVSNHIPRAPRLAPVLTLAYHRINRMVRRLDRLVAHWQAGTLPKPRPSRTRQPRRKQPDSDQPMPPRLPRGRAWLVRLVQPTAQLAGQVETFLATPETRALVEAAPQAGRLLRPLCRALGIAPPDWLRLPARPRPPRKPRTKPPRPPATPYRPLPAYVRAAVRAWKPRFG